jgi:hypothetical protein
MSERAVRKKIPLPLRKALIAIALSFAIRTNDNTTPIIPAALVTHQGLLFVFLVGTLIHKPR